MPDAALPDAAHPARPRALRIALAAALAFALGACAGPKPATPAEPAPSAVTIILTRHAEKAPGSPDPDLSPAGRERAAALARALAPSPPTSTLTTLTRRAIQTAEPAVAAFAIPAERTLTVPPTTTAVALAAILRARPAGDRILVVSHSNIIPDLLRTLGVPGDFTMGEADYGRVFIVRLSQGRSTLECDKLLENFEPDQKR